MKTTQEIRRQFLEYFRKEGHTVVPSSPVIPHEDPTLLFINAGMNQFKDVFLGQMQLDYTRATTTQKCIRAGGKHNDLENVGHTKRHLTFFEMLGNFSFGDYFKEDAIRFAWEVSTEIFGFDPEKLWPTVYTDDDEAFDLWTQYVPAERITRFGEKDNFWSMGDTGPCGPCTEILYDRGPTYSDARTPLEDVETGERFLEFWNLVFMQYNRDASGVMTPLPNPCIDTGSGLERVMSLIQGTETVFETDILRGLIDAIGEHFGIAYDPIGNPDKAAAFRVIADHLRALSFAIADGAQPSNVDRGYVLRKILRRAVRYGRLLSEDGGPFLADILPRLTATMGEQFPEIRKGASTIAEILTTEEEAFQRTLRRGHNLLNSIIEDAHKHGDHISGDDAFKLKDTYGFPLDEILLIAKDADLNVDMDRYCALEQEARERSRAVHKTTQQIAEENLFVDYIKKHGACEFVGYGQHVATGKVTALLVEGDFVDTLEAGQEGSIVLDKTPFYAEMGGQVGDIGLLQSEGITFDVEDCQSPYPGVATHIGKLKEGSISIGTTLTATVDLPRRHKIANNHTATHLLHWALSEILGERVKQAGSVVDDARLRFDFSHHKALTTEEIRQIEDLVNDKIRENIPVGAYELSYNEAQKNPHIKQFFGEKYGSTVRVIDIDFCKELCGGTHTSHTGNIGLFRIAKEGSIAAGIRRIEAVTGHAAEQLHRDTEDKMELLATTLKTQTPKLQTRVEKLLEENHNLLRQIEDAKKERICILMQELIDNVETIQGIRLLTAELPLSPQDLKDCAEQAMNKLQSGVLVFGAANHDKGHLVVKVSNDVAKQGVSAGNIIKELAPIIEGKGGGKDLFAQAGGTAPDKIPDALEKAKELLTNR